MNEYMTEKVACVELPTCFQPKQVFSIMHKPLDFKNIVFINRDKAEKTENYKQLVVFVLLKKGEKYCCYKRTESEKRLLDKYSIGFGGHISALDFRTGNFFYNAIARELIEESVPVRSYDVRKAKFLGHIYDASNEVGRMHLGCVFCIDAKDLSVENALTVKELLDLQLDNWSRFILHELSVQKKVDSYD